MRSRTTAHRSMNRLRRTSAPLFVRRAVGPPRTATSSSNTRTHQDGSAARAHGHLPPLPIPCIEHREQSHPAPGGGYCQVDEKLIDLPPRYWAPARREPAMMGIRNGRQAQLDNTMPPAVAWAERRPRASATWSSHRKTHQRRPTCSPTCHARWPTPTQCSRGSTWPRSRRAWRSRASPSRASGPLPRRGALCDAHRADHLDREASHWRWCADAGRPTRFKPSSPSPTDAVRDGSAKLGHPVQNVTREHGLTPLPR